jgi:hypothetical protein
MWQQQQHKQRTNGLRVVFSLHVALCLPLRAHEGQRVPLRHEVRLSLREDVQRRLRGRMAERV